MKCIKCNLYDVVEGEAELCGGCQLDPKTPEEKKAEAEQMHWPFPVQSYMTMFSRQLIWEHNCPNETVAVENLKILVDAIWQHIPVDQLTSLHVWSAAILAAFEAMKRNKSPSVELRTERAIFWRGSVTDLVADLAPLLDNVQRARVAKLLIHDLPADIRKTVG